MDLFKRIQDLSAIYDDDGPSATVPESRPMFNERTQFDKGGVAKVKEYVQSLPKNTVVTRKLIQDFIDSNDVNVNFQNLFTKNRPAYVGNFTKDKSITIDSSYPTGSKRYKKAKAIINDPKLKKEFIKFGNQKGISINDIREKFNIGREEFYEGGLRELFNKDFQLQQASKLKPKTINNITTVLNDKEASSIVKKGQVVTDEILTKIKIAPSEAATATVRIGQIYGGNKFDEKAFKNITTNVKASDNPFNTMNKFAFGNPYRSKLYNTALELIDEQLGNEKGTFASLKKKASYILKKNKIKGFDINEIAGVTGTARSGAGEFSQFIDVMDSNLNQKQMASFQSAFSQARQNIANNPNNFEAESKRINKLASRFEREYGVKLPRIRDVGDVEKYYSANRLKNLSDQGLDIKKASKNVGYTIQMPKGAKTIDDVIKEGTVFEDTLSEFGKADGGRIGYGIGGLSKLGITGSSRRFLEKIFGKGSLEDMIKRDPEMHRGLLEVVEMFRNRDKEGLKTYMKNFLPHMDDTQIEEFIVGDAVDSAGQAKFGLGDMQGQLIRLGSGRDYKAKIEAIKKLENAKKLDTLDVTEEMIRKPNASGGIQTMLGE